MNSVNYARGGWEKGFQRKCGKTQKRVKRAGSEKGPPGGVIPLCLGGTWEKKKDLGLLPDPEPTSVRFTGGRSKKRKKKEKARGGGSGGVRQRREVGGKRGGFSPTRPAVTGKGLAGTGKQQCVGEKRRPILPGLGQTRRPGGGPEQTRHDGPGKKQMNPSMNRGGKGGREEYKHGEKSAGLEKEDYTGMWGKKKARGHAGGRRQKWTPGLTGRGKCSEAGAGPSGSERGNQGLKRNRPRGQGKGGAQLPPTWKSGTPRRAVSGTGSPIENGTLRTGWAGGRRGLFKKSSAGAPRGRKEQKKKKGGGGDSSIEKKEYQTGGEHGLKI